MVALNGSGQRTKKRGGPGAHGQRQVTSEGRIATSGVSSGTRAVVDRVWARRAQSDMAREARGVCGHTASRWA